MHQPHDQRHSQRPAPERGARLHRPLDPHADLQLPPDHFGFPKHSRDRRAFLRRLGGLALGAPLVSWAACGRADGGGDPPADGASGATEVDALTRPVLVPWGDDAVQLLTPMAERPMAYVSRGDQRIYVDREFRERVYWILGAHISVSTGHWRIHLPGDPRNIPITPGDARREFEETDIGRWNPEAGPTEGDMRIRRPDRTDVRIDFRCAPVATTELWCSGGPWTLGRAGGAPGNGCREDFMSVGRARIYGDRDCTPDSELDSVRLLTWATPEEP